MTKDTASWLVSARVIPDSVWLIIIIFLIALSLRLLYLFLAPDTPVVYDAREYYNAGYSLVSGLDKLSPITWFTLGLRGPGYPLFLAGVFSLFSADFWPVRYIQAFIGAFSCIFVYLVGQQLVNRRLAFVSGFLMAIYPSLILFTGRILTETLSIFLLWFGIFMLVRGLRVNGVAWLAASGVVIGLACLTRPTLLPTVPFLIMAIVVGEKRVTLRRRVLMAVIFSLLVLGLLLVWNVVARGKTNPTVGSTGITTMTDLVFQSTNPTVRGWFPDDKAFVRENLDKYWWRKMLPVNPLYPVAAVANLVFYHLWFADNTWREVFILSPNGMHWLQRLLFLLGLGGLGISLTRWRIFAPIIFLLIGFSIVSVKWVEIRHNLPFMPAIFLLAGLFMVKTTEWLKNYFDWTKGLVILATAMVLATILFFHSQLLSVALLLPFVQPVILGSLGDLMIILLGFLVGGFVFKLAKSRLGRCQAVVIGFVPAVLFAILFGSYAYVGSIPRWHAWSIELSILQQPVVQEIHLPAPIPTEQIDMAVWLVDLQTDLNLPPLQVGLNGKWLSPEQYHWQQLFCVLNIVDGVLTPVEENSVRCAVYERYGRFSNRFLAIWPQWWSISVDPKLVGDRDVLLFALTGENQPAGQKLAPEVKLGGTFSMSRADSFHGPSVEALFTNRKTSIYRWLVVNDWRLWEVNELDSTHTKSYLTQPDLDKLTLPGYFGIRLLIRFKDGRVVIY